MKEYTIKKLVEQTNEEDFTILTKLYLYYELSSYPPFVEFDFCDEFIDVMYNCYVDNDNVENICEYCRLIADYFSANDINPLTITDKTELANILYKIH